MTSLRHNPNRHFILGVIILGVGVILLLDRMGFADANKIFEFWPLILIYFGVQKLVSASSMVSRFWGGFITLLGISFQLEALGLRGIRFSTIWPVFLICIGILLVMRRYENRSNYCDPPPPSAPPSAEPGAPAPGGTPSADPSAAAPSDASAATTSSQTQPESQVPPQAPPQPPPPPQASNYPGWDPDAWKQNPSWRKFQKNMNRLSEDVNRNWQTRANWSADPNAPSAGQAPGQAKWQPNAHWQDSSQPRLDDVYIFWGGRRRIISKVFLGGEIVAIFGGFEIDLTQADFATDHIKIEVVSIFGGGEIRVPSNWEVTVDSVGIFGGTTDRTWHPQQQGQPSPGPVKRITIEGVCIFGGLTVKN